MASVWGWFAGSNNGKKKQQQSTKAILALRAQLEMLRKRESHTEKLIAEQDTIARKNVTANKTVAKAALKRKKQFEANLVTTQQHINTLEAQVNAVETANLNVETLNVMKSASDAMRKLQGNMNVDKVEETMDNIREGMQVNQEITDAITNIPLGNEPDEEDLMNELNAMEQEDLDNKMLSAPAAPVTATPQISSGSVKAQPVAAEDEEEEELKKLQAEMAI